MAQTITFTTQPRSDYGTRAAKRLREKGLVPAVLYGHKEADLTVVLPTLELERAVRSGAHVVDLVTDGKSEKARIREVQWDHLGVHLVHADFMRVSADERIQVPVKVELRGTAPGVGAGVVIDQPIHTLKVECSVLEIPDSIRVNVEKLQIGHPIHVRELVLPEGVKALADGDLVVVQLKAAQAEVTPTPEAGPAEPEVITAKKEKDEEAD
jgi:large subunit ribosomal protein L25